MLKLPNACQAVWIVIAIFPGLFVEEYMMNDSTLGFLTAFAVGVITTAVIATIGTKLFCKNNF